MAVRTFRLTAGADGNFAALAEADQTVAVRADGWTVARIAASNFANFDTGTKLASTAFATTAQPASLLLGSTANAAKTPVPISGTFAATNWTFTFGLRAVTGSSQKGRVNMRVFKSANADGSGATELTTARLVGTTSVSIIAASDVTSVVTWSPGATITLANEYLFFALAWEITTASGNNASDVFFSTGVSGSTGTWLVTPNFVPLVHNGGVPSAQLFGAITAFHPLTGYGALVLADGARAYWRLGEAGVPIADSTGNTPSFGSGQVGGTLAYGHAGLLRGDANASISFNTGWLSQGAGAALDVRDTFTVEAWLQLRQTSGNPYMGIYSAWGGCQYLRINPSNQVELISSGTQVICTSTVALSDLNTHHVVATKNGATVKLYIDGVDVTGAVSNYTFASAPSWMALGDDQGGEPANLVMDEVALYPTALSAAKVAAHYSLGRTVPGEVNPPPVSDYVARWDPSNVASLTVAGGVMTAMADLSGNGYTMAAGGAPEYGTRKLNGITVPSYNAGVPQYLLGAGLAPSRSVQTFFIVGQLDSVSGVDVLLSGDQGGCYNLRVVNGTLDLLRDYTVDILQHPTPIAAGKGFLASTVLDNSTAQLRLNGVPATPVAYSGGFAGGSTYTVIGGAGSSGDNYNGLIAEAILFPRALSPAEVASMESWLTAKWLTAPVTQTVRVPSVYPSGSTPTIIGTFLIGDGHVVGGLPGTRFGAITSGAPPQSKPVGGVSSAQAFGSLTIKGVVAKPIGGVPTAQAFGSLTIKAAITRPVGGVPSAQAFGAIVTLTAGKTAVAGVPSAQAFGVVTRITGGVSTSSSGVPSAQAFGAVTIKAVVSLGVTGLGSPQAFGLVRFALVIHVSGLGSAQAFGVVTVHAVGPAGQTIPVTGIVTAQRFGVVTIKTSIKSPTGGVPSAQAFGSLFFVVAQSVLVAGLGSGQAFGIPEAFLVWLYDTPCLEGDLVPSDEQDLVLAASECIIPYPTIIGEFIIGDGHVIGGIAYFLSSLDEGSTEPLQPSTTLTLDLQPVGCD